MSRGEDYDDDGDDDDDDNSNNNHLVLVGKKSQGENNKRIKWHPERILSKVYVMKKM